MTSAIVRQRKGPLIQLMQLTKVYGCGQAAVKALSGINLSIKRGEFLAVMGASGSGKSTCMNILGCLDTATSGSYRFMDTEVSRLSQEERALLRRHYLGFIFQGFNLLGRSSALENVELPLMYRGIPSRERRELALQALEAVGLSGWEDHTPGQLSGGQQQRVAIARAIGTNPEVLFADEPTGNLDTARSHEIMELLTNLHQEKGITVLMVTHSAEMADYATSRIEFCDGLITTKRDHRDL